MNKETFQDLMMPVMQAVSGKPVDQELAKALNQDFPPDSETFRTIEAACHEAIKEGWMCAHGDQGRRFGRVIKPSAETHDLSVDVVELRDIVGPHHSHPTGEICMTMPVTEGAQFDGHDAGWCVNNPGSAHNPTVAGGEALVLYLLPGGEIEFTK
jgi:hypothetical protein